MVAVSVQDKRLAQLARNHSALGDKILWRVDKFESFSLGAPFDGRRPVPVPR